ncbi:low-density lipoprotein receptor-related protein-like [Bolinopsis microptera]|uniref:low-density lipoprotein receptor-related protein-like n=1 Tax=Bolinopsis microptera TaxID=2820187 RepID=UPI00307A8C43
MVLKGTMLACIILLCLQGVIFADCPAGSFMSARGCKKCGLDQYSAAGATSCTPCPKGMLSKKGSDSVNDCYHEKDATGDEVFYSVDPVTEIEYFTKKGAIEEEGPTEIINKGYVCPEGQTKCGDIDECVPNRGLCNGGAACSNGFDESAEFCTSFECPVKQEKCADGIQCFPSSGKCDKFKIPHCNDKSDDVGCTCKEGEMECADGNGCASLQRKCDGSTQCADGSDESRDICYVRGSGKCGIGTRKCATGNQCVAKGRMCDGSTQCIDGSDEALVFCITYECPDYQIKCDGSKCLSRWNLCDSEPDCKDGSDEDPAWCAAYECPAAKKKCADGMQCVPKKLFCDGKADCTDGSDESEEECAEEKGEGKSIIEVRKGKGKQTIEKGERIIEVPDETSRRGPPEPEDPEPVDPEPVDPEPVDPEPVDPEPVDPEPVDCPAECTPRECPGINPHNPSCWEALEETRFRGSVSIGNIKGGINVAKAACYASGTCEAITCSQRRGVVSCELLLTKGIEKMGKDMISFVYAC